MSAAASSSASATVATTRGAPARADPSVRPAPGGARAAVRTSTPMAVGNSESTACSTSARSHGRERRPGEHHRTRSIDCRTDSSDFRANDGFLVVMETEGERAGHAGNGGFDYVYARRQGPHGRSSLERVVLRKTGERALAAELERLRSRSRCGSTVPTSGTPPGSTSTLETTRDNGQSIGDDAPDGNGVFTYGIVLPTAPPPPPPTTTTPPPAKPGFTVSPVGFPQLRARRFVRSCTCPARSGADAS